MSISNQSTLRGNIQLMANEFMLYNTLSRQKEVFTPITQGKVGLYCCGPTVYAEPHLGHALGPITIDVLRNWLEVLGYDVRYVMNVTDVGHLTDDADEGEDKLAKRAKLEQLEPMQIAEKYFWSYFDALAKMGVARPDITPRASGHIIEQINLTQTLLEAGYAYEVNGSVYFEVERWQDYGVLSRRKVDDAQEGTRVEVRSEKRHPQDFALWKKAEPNHIMRWPSPWGDGFPGWHIECSAMSTKYLGDEFDIHAGGLDLIFPHHECEIAQARAAGKKFANYWLHWNFITLEGEKMSKSKGHFITLTELFEKYDPFVVRFDLLGNHYRSLSDFSEASLEASSQGLKRLRACYDEVQRRLEAADILPKEADEETEANALTKYYQQFFAAMNDDMNTPQAIASLFDATRDINTHLNENPSPAYLLSAYYFFQDLLAGVLGVPAAEFSTQADDGGLVEGLVDMLIAQRKKARLERDFATSDAVRDGLKALGIVLEDTPEGSRWKR